MLASKQVISGRDVCGGGAMCPAPLEAVQLLEELDSDYEVEVVAFTVPHGLRSVGSDSNFQRKSWEAIAHHRSLKDLVVNM